MPAWYEDFAAPRPVIRTCHEPAHRAVGAVQADGPFSAAIWSCEVPLKHLKELDLLRTHI